MEPAIRHKFDKVLRRKRVGERHCEVDNVILSSILSLKSFQRKLKV